MHFIDCFILQRFASNMFENLHTALRMDNVQLRRKIIHIVEEEDLLGAFMINHFIHLALHQNSRIVLVGLENTFGHYNSVG